MKNIKASVGIVDKEFARNIISKYTSFSMNRSLVIFKKGISAFLDRIEFVYALPLMVIKRNTLILEKTRVASSIRSMWNLLNIRFENKFSSSWYEFPSLRIPPIRVYISLAKFLPDKSFRSQTLSLAKIIPEKQTDWFSKRILLYGPRVVSSQLMKTIQYAEQRILNSFTQRRVHSGARAKYTCPITEYVVRRFPQITKERIVEKKMTSEQQVQPRTIDVDRLANQIYQLLERKVRIERERKGL